MSAFLRDARYFFPVLFSGRGVLIIFLKGRRWWGNHKLARAYEKEILDVTLAGSLGLAKQATVRLRELQECLHPLIELSMPQGAPAAPTLVEARAEEVLSGRQQIFGQSLPVGWKPKWDWCWDHLPAGHPLRGDHRTRWEVSRLAGMLPLARAAYYADRGEISERLGREAAESYIEALIDFDRSNPGPRGVAWEHGIEPALRVISMAQAMPFLVSTQAFHARHMDVIRVLDRHIQWLHVNLSRDKVVQGNHFLAELSALVTAGHLLPQARPRWWGRANLQARLEREIIRQFHEDGVNVEQSLTYEKFILEFLLVPLAFARARGCPFQPEVHARLSACVRHLSKTTQPDGLLPRVGDCDSSRGADWGDEDPHCSRPILVRADSLLDSNDGSPAEKVKILRAGDAKLFAFLEGGHVVVEDPQAGRSNFIFLRCGPFGWGIPGPASHSHADLMAPIIFLHGDELLTDPGVYGYVVGDHLRDGLRIWDAHSAISFDPSVSPRPDGIFRWRDIPPPGKFEVEGDEHHLNFLGEVHLRRGRTTLKWHRTLSYNQLREVVTIEDAFKGHLEGPVTWTLRFAPGVHVEEENGLNSLQIVAPSGNRSQLVLTPPGQVRISEDIVCPAYGVLAKAKVVRRTLEELPGNSIITIAVIRSDSA